MTIEEVKDLLPGDVVKAQVGRYGYVRDYKVINTFVKNGTHYINATCCEKNYVSDRVQQIARSYISKLVSSHYGGDHIKAFTERIKICKREISKQNKMISDYQNKINWMKSKCVTKFDEKAYKADVVLESIMNPNLSQSDKKKLILKHIK